MKRLIAVALFLAPIAAHADDVKKLTGADLSVQTHKWEGKTIETTAHCFYADKSDYRCHSGNLMNGVRLDFTKIEPDISRQKVEDSCDTIEKMVSKACTLRIQFVYDHFDEMEHTGREATTVIFAKDGVATIVGK